MNPNLIYDSILNSLPLPVLIIDNNFIVRHMNLNAKKMLKKINLSINDICNDNNELIQPYIKKNLEKFLNSTLTYLKLKKQILFYNSCFYFDIYFNKINIDSNNSFFTVISFKDITKEFIEKKKNINLKKELLKCMSIFQLIPDAFLTFNKEGILLDIKCSSTDIFNSFYHKMLYKNIDEICGNQYMLSTKFKSCILKSLKSKSLIFFQYDFYLKKIGFQSFDARCIPVSNDEVIFILRNITKSKQTAEEMLKIEKLNSIGTLAGGVAHDFNNILSIILGNISMLKININKNSKIGTKLIHMENIIFQAKNLTQQLLTFSKESSPIKKVIYINNLIKETSSLVLSGCNTSCNLYIPDNLWPIEIDLSQISQVLSNLLINACQAMPNGGSITIRCRNVHLIENKIVGLKAGKYVVISIKDQGMGIPEYNLIRIFDPYFTTKEKGSGLGLACSYSIIKKHNGHIIVKSKVDKGTVFYIYLPASDIIPLEIPTINQPLIHGKNKILIMDDEYELRKILSDMLIFLGHKVTTSKDGTEVIDLYKKSIDKKDPFDIIILDLTVPGGMGGAEAIKHILKINPNAKVIISSGYSSGGIISKYKEYGFKGFINKPYTIEELSNILGNIVD